MEPFGKSLVIVGLLVAAVGLFVWLGPSVPWLGRLPGDIRIERPGFRFFFPITTCILISLVVSALWYLLSRFR